MPPETIGGRYEVLREIGRGGMGAVWLCRDRVLGREVAAKQLGGLPGESTPHLARALREARTSAALSHPNVVSIYDAVEEGRHVWLVMEYVPSRTLSQIISKDGPLAPSRAARIGAQIADGLAAAHERGTVHRDVKPGNVLVGEDDHAKISDFGIARSVDDETLTQTGMVTGTPMYFSPQLARGVAPTPADDVWALGATLFSATQGEQPWPSQENPLALLVHIAENEPPDPARAGPLAPVIRRMMAVDPAGRGSMAEAARELHDIAQGARSDETPTAVFPAPPPAPPPAQPPAPSLAQPPVPPTPTQPTAVPSGAGASDDARARRSRLLPLLGILVAVIVVVIAALLAGNLLGGDDGTPSADQPASEQERQTGKGSTSTGGTSESAPETTEAAPTTEAEPSTDSSTESSTEDVPASAPEDFVTDYYALLPDDTKDAWDLLSDDMQDEVGSYGSYQGFWRTIESVSVDGTTAQSGDSVAVDLTYTTSDGSESETRLITVQDTGDGLQIVDDEVATS